MSVVISRRGLEGEMEIGRAVEQWKIFYGVSQESSVVYSATPDKNLLHIDHTETPCCSWDVQSQRRLCNIAWRAFMWPHSWIGLCYRSHTQKHQHFFFCTYFINLVWMSWGIRLKYNPESWYPATLTVCCLGKNIFISSKTSLTDCSVPEPSQISK